MSFKEVLDAKERIERYIHKTPVFTSSTVDSFVGRQVYFKCEQFQKTGSFKARGALNAVLKLQSENPDVPGVVTHSSGNHGQALAWAAKIAGIPCSVVVPNNTPSAKTDAIKSYGARLVYCEPNPKARVDTCEKVSKETGQVYISSSDHYDVIAGQGTIATEFLEQVPELDAIMASVCGGGMTAGIAIATKHIRPQAKVFAVEPQGKELEPCLRAKQRLWPDDQSRFVDTIAEGIRIQQVGKRNFPIMCELVEEDVFTVTNEEIVVAMKYIWQKMKLVIETSAAATVAAAMSDKMRKMDPDVQKIGVVLCGGNVDFDNLPW